jgi:hypothetical protein
MKKFIIYLTFIMMSSIYAQCDDYSESQCNNDNNCEWVANIDSGFCSDFDYNSVLCNSINQCDWSSYQINCGTGTGYSDCVSQLGCSYSWLTYTCSGLTTVTDCGGGYYEIDNGFCQELQNMECSEMNEPQCSNDDSCEWVESIDTENCHDILDCTGGCTWQDCEAIEGCWWHFGTAYYDPSGCYGEHEVDNSYCQEIEILECSEMNETECISSGSCDWIEDYEWSSCSNYGSAVECSWANNNGGNCDWSWNSTQWQDTCSGGSFQLDNSYCEENPYELGDINQDNLINVMDIISVVNLILNDSYEEIADLNQDQSINVIDILLIVDIILNN